MNRTPLPPLRLNPDLPPKLEDVINRALEKDRELRYQHAADMKSELLRLKRDTETGRVGVASSASVTVAEAPVAGRRTLRKFVLPIAILIVAALIAGGHYYRSRSAKPLTDKDAVVLADFVNSTGDPVFDDTLKQAPSIALSQSPFLNVLSEDKVGAALQMMARRAGTPIRLVLHRQPSPRRAPLRSRPLGLSASFSRSDIPILKQAKAEYAKLH